MKKKILVIDDESAIRKLLEITLQNSGFEMSAAATAAEGLLLAHELQPDLILLDLGLPDENGQEVLKKLRNWFVKPIIILSVQNGEEEIVHALDHGANDYLCKPFRTGELLARIRSSMRTGPIASSKNASPKNGLEINLDLRLVKKNGMQLKLTNTEFELLSLFVKNEGRVLTHQFVLRELWGNAYADQSQNLRVFIAQLRKKIENDPARPAFILTESGVGYRFVTGD